jgi:hypothetical protein
MDIYFLIQSINIQALVPHTTLFYYLWGTPSLLGGASALAFFVAIGSWTWLDNVAAEHGWGGKICSISLDLYSASMLGFAFIWVLPQKAFQKFMKQSRLRSTRD